MAVISKADLKYKYTWSTDKGDNPQYTGALDRAKIDRDEGYEVLYFLNAICKDKDQAIHAEHLIKTKLPGSVQLRRDIHNWLVNNWNA